MILNGDIDLAQQLAQWIEDEKFGWHLCYRASDDGWKAQDFHKKCDHVGSTVTLVRCENNIFGGYTDQSWNGPPPLPSRESPTPGQGLPAPGFL